MKKAEYSVLSAVVVAMICLAALALQGCIEESPYYVRREHQQWMSERHLVCDADGDRCVRCGPDGVDCVPAPGVWEHHYWDPYS